MRASLAFSFSLAAILAPNCVGLRDFCKSDKEPDAPQPAPPNIFRLESDHDSFMTICGSCPERKIIMCPKMYTWRQAFTIKGSVIHSAYNPNIVMTKVDFSPGCAIAMRPIGEGCDHDWDFSGDTPVKITFARDQRKDVFTASDCDEIRMKREPFTPRFYVQNTVSKLVVDVDDKPTEIDGQSLNFWHMSKLDQGTKQLWELDEKNVLRNVKLRKSPGTLKHYMDDEKRFITADDCSPMPVHFMEDFVRMNNGEMIGHLTEPKQNDIRNPVLGSISPNSALPGRLYYARPDGSDQQKFKQVFV